MHGVGIQRDGLSSLPTHLSFLQNVRAHTAGRGSCAVIRYETDTDGANQVQRHETDPGEPPRRLRAPGMHRVPSGDLLSNTVEDLGGGSALCRRAENLSETNTG